MIHPDLELTVQTGKELVSTRRLESGEAILALLTFANVATQHMGHELLTIANAEHGAAGGENLRIDLRAAGFVNAIRAAGDDDALAARQIRIRWFAGLNIGMHAQIANLPGDQMAVLAARVEDGNLWRAQTFANVERPLPHGRGSDRVPSQSLAPRVVALDALNNQLLRLIEQRSGVGHRINSLQHLGVGFDGDLLRILVTKRGRVHLALELLLDPGVVIGPLGLSERP